jgi:microcystin-dependent protein
MGATRNLVPRNNDEGQIGVDGRRWLEGHFGTIHADNLAVSGGVGFVPIGTVLPYAGIATDYPPTGYLFCWGGSLNKATYAEYLPLFSVIGYRYGGSGNTFNVPDLQGMFLRGHDSGAVVDVDAGSRLNSGDATTGANVGTYQGDAIRNITGQIRGINGAANTSSDHGFRPGTWGAFTSPWSTNQYDVYNYAHYQPGVAHIAYFSAATVVPVGSDNRPKNIAVSYIIKY